MAGLSVPIAITILLVWSWTGCRSLQSPPRKGATTSASVQPQPASDRTDTTGERQRLLPLRAYMDEIARRQAAIESRLDTLASDVAALRRTVELALQRQRASIAVESPDSVIAGPEPPPRDSAISKQSRRNRSGVILPDNNDAIETPPRADVSPSKKRVPKQKAPVRSTTTETATKDKHYDPSPERKKKATLTTDVQEKRVFDSALVTIRAQRFDSAVAILTSLIDRRSPQKGEYLYWRALSHYFAGRLNSALKDAEDSWKLLQTTQSPRRADAMYLLADIYDRQGEVERARSLLRALIERFPSSDAAILARRKLQQLMTSKN